MPLIDIKYFVGKLNIPNTGTGGPIDTQLKYFIQEHEIEFLRSALGIALCKAFITALGVADGDYTNVNDGVAADSIDQKWKDLLNGKEYTDLSNRAQKWNGLISISDGSRTTLKSPIANYVYFYFMRENVTPTTSVGVVQGVAENAQVISPKQKLCNAWNSMAEEMEQLIRFLRNNQTVYPEWTSRDGYDALEKFRYINPFF